MAQNAVKIMRARDLAASGRAHDVRVAAGVSLAEVAEDVGVTTGCVHGWERGRYLPRGERAVRYADVLAQLERAMRP